MYVCLNIRLYICLFRHVCTVCIYVCMYICLTLVHMGQMLQGVNMYVNMYVCMYVTNRKSGISLDKGIVFLHIHFQRLHER